MRNVKMETTPTAKFYFSRDARIVYFPDKRRAGDNKKPHLCYAEEDPFFTFKGDDMLIFVIVIALWTSFIAGLSLLLCGAEWRRVLVAKLFGLAAGAVFAMLAAHPLMEAMGMNLLPTR